MITDHWLESVIVRSVLCIIWDLPHVKDYNPHQCEILQTIYVGLFNQIIPWQEGLHEYYMNIMVYDTTLAAIPLDPNVYHSDECDSDIFD